MFSFDKKNRRLGSTIIENAFILDYLPSANAEQIKVYLLGVHYCQQNNSELNIDSMSRELSLELNVIESALRFWERRNLVKRISDNPLSYHFLPVNEQSISNKSDIIDEDYRSFSEDMYAIFDGKRKIKQSEISIAYEWIEELKISKEIVILLINHCISTKGANFSFAYAQALILDLKDKNIVDDEEAAIKFFHMDKKARDGAKKVLNRFGQQRPASDDEIAMYSKWISHMKFKEKDILAACQETVKASTPSFAYLDKVLSRLHTQNVTAGNVEKMLSRQDEISTNIKDTLNILGVKVSISLVEPIYSSWLKIFDSNVILEAANFVHLGDGKFEDLSAFIDILMSKTASSEKAIEYIKTQTELQVIANKMMRFCGMNGNANEKLREQVAVWKSSFNEELMLFAAEQAINAKQKFKYIDTVLNDYKSRGILSLEQAKKASAQIGSDKAPKSVSAQNYEQRDYTKSDISRSTLRLIKEAEDLNE